VVEDVTFVNNHLRNSAGGINILGRDRTWPSGSGPTRRILIRNNLFEDIGGNLFQLLDQTADVVIDHNTALNSSNIANLDSGPHTGFVFRNNIVLHNQYGFAGTAKSPGNDSIEAFLPGAVIRRNVLVGADAARYPGDNFFPASIAEVGFVDLPGGDLRLASTSPYRGGGTDGRDPGVDIDELAASLGGMAGISGKETGSSDSTAPRRPRSPMSAGCQ
jgi:hypothetical protein